MLIKDMSFSQQHKNENDINESNISLDLSVCTNEF